MVVKAENDRRQKVSIAQKAQQNREEHF